MVKVANMVEADKSDIFDVLSYISFARPVISRDKRVEYARERIMTGHDEKLQSFLDFVLQQYVRQGVGELDNEKIADHLKVKYYNLADAQTELGSMEILRNSFLKLQSSLFGVGGEFLSFFIKNHGGNYWSNIYFANDYTISYDLANPN